eukprot:PhM_4_TR16748/c2_g5_i6/m.79523
MYDPVEMVDDRVVQLYPSYEPKCPDGVLDPIPPGLTGRVDLSRFLDAPSTCPLGKAARLLLDPLSLPNFLLDDLPPLAYCASARVYRKFATEMLDAGLCEKTRLRPRGFAKFFTAQKKLGEDGVPILRTILDCRTANEHFRQPDPVNLPTLADMLHEFRHVDCLMTLDLRHMYHQVRLGAHIKPYFTVAMGSLRLTWKVLPMGWTWACFVAQAITTYAVAGKEALDWTELPRMIRRGNCSFFVVYDNIIGGGPVGEIQREWKKIEARLASLAAIIKEQDIAVSGESVSTLGLEWFPSPSGLQWCFLPRFVKKLEDSARDFSLPQSLSARAIAGGLGLVAWGRYATFGNLFDVIGAYKALADLVAREGWGGHDATSQYQCVLTALQSLLTCGRQCFAEAVTDEVLVFSDAHVSGYGFVGGHADVRGRTGPLRVRSERMGCFCGPP